MTMILPGMEETSLVRLLTGTARVELDQIPATALAVTTTTGTLPIQTRLNFAVCPSFTGAKPPAVPLDWFGISTYRAQAGVSSGGTMVDDRTPATGGATAMPGGLSFRRGIGLGEISGMDGTARTILVSESRQEAIAGSPRASCGTPLLLHTVHSPRWDRDAVR
jgi:hypothetical protein